MAEAGSNHCSNVSPSRRGVAAGVRAGAARRSGLLALRLGAMAVVTASLGFAGRAHACSRPEPLSFEIDAALRTIDQAPPTAPQVSAGVAQRYSGEYCRGGLCAVSTCGSMAWVTLEFTPATDDRTAEHDLGYQLRFVEGNVPTALAGPLDDIAVGSAHWSLDFSFDDVVSLDATFQVVAIDRAGNVSEPSAPFHVGFDGCTQLPLMDGCLEDMQAQEDAAGCSLPSAAPSTRHGLGLGFGALALLASTLWRRRR